MWFFGQAYEDLCKQKCRRYKVYADIYEKSENGEYTLSNTYTQDGSNGQPSIVSVKIVKGLTSGSFSYGGAFSGQLTLVTTANAQIPSDDAKIIISVAFVSDEGAETQKAPLGTFFAESVFTSLFTKTVKAFDGISKLTKYYVPVESEFPLTALKLYEKIGKIAGVSATYERFLSLNNPTITEPPIKNADGDDKYYTYRELAGMIASINAGNAYINAYNELDISTPDIGLKMNLPIESVINYTDTGAVNSFTTTFWVQTYEGESTPPEIDPLSLEYDPSIMVIDFPLKTNSDYTEMQSNIDNKISGISYNGIVIKKQGTGRQEIGDLLAFSDTYRNKTFDNVLVMGIVYDISAQNGFTETLYSLSQSEAKQQAKGLSLNSKVDKIGSAGGGTSSKGVGEFTNEDENSEKFNDYEKNYINAETSFAHVAGRDNSIDEGENITSYSEAAVILSGYQNTIKSSLRGSILNGMKNELLNGTNSTIISGAANNLSGGACVIVSGMQNTILFGSSDAILCGMRNRLTNLCSAIICGQDNIVSSPNCAVLAGQNNTISRISSGAVVLGKDNTINAAANCIVCGSEHTTPEQITDCIVCGAKANPKFNHKIVVGNRALGNVFYVDNQGNVYANSFNIIGETASEASVFSAEKTDENIELAALTEQINQMKTEIETLKAEITELKGETK